LVREIHGVAILAPEFTRKRNEGVATSSHGIQCGPERNPLQCAMARLHGIFADREGAEYIGDGETHRVSVLRKK